LHDGLKGTKGRGMKRKLANKVTSFEFLLAIFLYNPMGSRVFHA